MVLNGVELRELSLNEADITEFAAFQTCLIFGAITSSGDVLSKNSR
jgi:hypothetical protein